jgi:hypothetical protein
MAFQPDRRFESLREAWTFLLGEQARRPVDRLWFETPAGLVVPHEAPRYLFRGECGNFETTLSNIHRRETYTLDGHRLSAVDLRVLQQLIPDLARRFLEKDDYSLDEFHAYGLLQHYGLPTTIVDFTANLGCAFAFAAAREAKVGRVAVLPLGAASATVKVVDFTDHPCAERPKRQGAFGVIMTDELLDLKSDAVRSRLNLRWYEFPVLRSDRDYLSGKHEEFVRYSDDPSSGFLRYHITEYVEAHEKFSPELTKWLVERVPVAPYCFLVKRFEGKDVEVKLLGRDALKVFNEDTERESSKRYWSSAHPAACSWDRMRDWAWPPAGSIGCDPRTYHPEQ